MDLTRFYPIKLSFCLLSAEKAIALQKKPIILLANHRIIIIEIDRIVNEQKMTQITTTELHQNLQTLFIEVERTKIPLTVIHEGKPLVIIYPA
ncbi:MAG: hypothetical protein WBV73_23735, partial [Phormidium sp.]